MTINERLDNKIAEIRCVNLREAVFVTLMEKDVGTGRCPGSLGHHHAYANGLSYHTLEVVEYSQAIAKAMPGVDRDVLLAAALCHDVCKTSEYVPRHFRKNEELPKRHLILPGDDSGGDGCVAWVTSDFYNRIHHIQGSYAEFTHQARKAHVEPRVIDAVGHAILAHHGPVKEWKSNIAPQTLEAVILHQADYLSAHFGATKESPPQEV